MNAKNSDLPALFYQINAALVNTANVFIKSY